ncbi:hypothetical protein R6Q57_009068, partial [Mikania cordata]
TIARNHSYASLIHSSWHKVPLKDKIWEYVLIRSIVCGLENANVSKIYAHDWSKKFDKIRDEMIDNDTNKELPTLNKMFEHTRKRTEGRAYVDTYDDTKRKIGKQMKNYKSLENESALLDPFMIVMNKENNGTVDFIVEGLLID